MYSAVPVSRLWSIDIQGHNSWQEGGGHRARRTLDDLGDPVNPTLGSEGRADNLDARPGALDSRLG